MSNLPASRMPRRRPSSARGAGVAAAVLACLVGLLSTPSAGADDLDAKKKAADAQVQAVKDALAETSTDLADAYLALQATTAKLPAAQAELANAQAAARAADRHNREVGQRLQVALANEARAQEAVAANAKTLDKTQRTLDLFAADLFQGGGGGSELSVALGATSPDDFATRIVLADTVTSLTNEAIDGLAAARADGAATQAYLTAVRAEIADLKRQAEEALAAAKSAQAQAQAKKAALDSLQAEQAAHAADVETKKATELQQLAAAEAYQAQVQAELVERARKAREAEAARKAAEEAARQAAAAKGQTFTPPQRDTAGNSGAFLSYPANGPITSGFGWRIDPILGISRLHKGIDFAIDCGTPVYATADGEVIFAGLVYSYGNRVMIDHGMQRGVDLVTTYNHNSRIVVFSGSVKRGQLIAYSGTTGNSTGCHLHFETMEDGQFVNPRRWI